MQINAHRGDPIQFRENTMPSFASAVALGADCIELDIHASFDNKATVLHDDTLERLWGIRRSVSSLTYEDIFKMTKSGDVYVPRLEEVLGTFSSPIMIDFVDDAAVEPILGALEEYPVAAQRCIISSGNVPALMTIRSTMKNISIAFTWNDVIPPSESLLQELDVQYFNPNYRVYQDDFVTETARHIETGDVHNSFVRDSLERRQKHPEWYQTDSVCGPHLVRYMHRTGRNTSAWTVDNPRDIDEMMKLGVDLLTTNDIRTCMEVRNGKYFA